MCHALTVFIKSSKRFISDTWPGGDLRCGDHPIVVFAIKTKRFGKISRISLQTNERSQTKFEEFIYLISNQKCLNHTKSTDMLKK